MVKPNGSEGVNPLCSIPSIPCHASGVEFMHGPTLGSPLPSKPCLGVKLSDVGHSMSSIFLEPNKLDLLCDEHIKVPNKCMKAKDLRENSSQEGLLDV